MEVHRDAQLGVPEQHRHFSEFYAGRDQETCRAVTEIVKTHLLHLRLGGIEERVQCRQNVSRVQASADPPGLAFLLIRGAYEACIHPIRASLEPLLAEALAQLEAAMDDCASFHLRQLATDLTSAAEVDVDAIDDLLAFARDRYDTWKCATLLELRGDLEAEARAERHATVTETFE